MRSARTASQRLTSLLLWALPLAFLAVFYVYPLAAVIGQAFRMPPGDGGQHIWAVVWKPLRFTVLQASLSTLLTLLVGMPAAAVMARFKFPGKRLLRVLTTLPFILPTVVVAAGFNALLGPRGWVNLALMGLFNLTDPPVQFLNSLGAILLAHVFYNTTIVLRVVGSEWSRLDTRLADSARTLGATPWRVLCKVTLPLLKQPILAATALVFLFNFTSFGVILLLGGAGFATLEVEIATRALNLLDFRSAAVLSLVQLLCTLMITLGYQRVGRGRVISLTPRISGENDRKPVTWMERLWVGVVVLVVVILLVTPLVALAARSVTKLEPDRGERGGFTPRITLAYYQELFTNRRQSIFYVPPIQAVANSFLIASIVVVISLVLGFITAYRLQSGGWARRAFDVLVMLPMGTSAVTLGLGFILVFGRVIMTLGIGFWLVPLAHSLVAYPFVVRTLQPAVAAIPPRLKQAASVLGASPWQVWYRVELPILKRAAMVSAIFAFTISMGEFGATTFLARPEYPTLPVAIYRFISQPGALNYGQAMAMSTILLMVCAASIALLERLEQGEA
ncbi:MAG: iron ABC transporter permease [Anaerolineae bacterium]|nr:iron ABC transporter permease [Anaerolineae bacterium]